MIFKSVSDLQTKNDKIYFREKIDMFVNTVCLLEQHLKLPPVSIDKNLAVSILIQMGVLKDADELSSLKKILSLSLFEKLLYTATSYAVNRSILATYLVKFDNTARHRLQFQESTRNAPTMVDLFCGAGGLSLGFKQAGFKTLLAADFDPLCVETYKFNHPEISAEKVLCEDIKAIADCIDKYIDNTVDIVIGGPPCQGFSSANKHHRVIDDPRNELYKYFLKVVGKLSPKFVVMENVKGMLKVASQVVEDYSNVAVTVNGQAVSYIVSYRLLNSCDFGVAQSRERLIYIAIRSDIAQSCELTPDILFERIKINSCGTPMYTLENALEGLRSLIPPHKMNVGEVDTEESGRKIDYNPFVGMESPYAILINNGKSNPLVFNHKARYCSELNYEIYKRMKPGDDATDPKIADIMPYAHRNDKFKDKYYRLYGDRPCRTITAHLRADCHSHIHPYEDRALTPREAARVQSFPDDYMFLGPYLLTYRQIGNAVPVVMAKSIAKVIIEILEKGDQS